MGMPEARAMFGADVATGVMTCIRNTCAVLTQTSAYWKHLHPLAFRN